MPATHEQGFEKRRYSAYGHCAISAQGAWCSFQGNPIEVYLRWYLLGQRFYVPGYLRRFISPDAYSPFHVGGLNRYAFCGGDPVNRIDPTGSAWLGWLRLALGWLGTGGVAGAGAASHGVMQVARHAVAGSTVMGNAIKAAATVLDTASVVTTIGSVAATASGHGGAASVMGMFANGAGVTAGGSSLASRFKTHPRAAGTGRSSAGGGRILARVREQGVGADVRPFSTATSSGSQGKPQNRWWQGTDLSGNHHVASDAMLSFDQIPGVMEVLNDRIPKHHNYVVLAGNHGFFEQKFNPGWNGKPISLAERDPTIRSGALSTRPDSALLREAKAVEVRMHEYSGGRDVAVESIQGWTAKEIDDYARGLTDTCVIYGICNYAMSREFAAHGSIEKIADRVQARPAPFPRV